MTALQTFNQDKRRQQEIKSRPILDDLYCKIFPSLVGVKRDIYELDKFTSIDAILELGNGMILTIQEKVLSHKYSSFASLTVEYEQNQHTGERGNWFNTYAQYYFVGYLTNDETDLCCWIMVVWPELVRLSQLGRIPWQQNKNKDGKALASFKFVTFEDIPRSCILGYLPLDKKRIGRL